MGICSGEDTWHFEHYLQIVLAQMTTQPIILADAALSITKACSNLNLARSSCWFHCMQALKNRLKQKKYDAETVIQNVRVLQRASSTAEFSTGQKFNLKNIFYNRITLFKFIIVLHSSNQI
jgi:hypothetical protein